VLFHVQLDRGVMRFLIPREGLEKPAADFLIVQEPSIRDVEKLARVIRVQVSFQIGIRPASGIRDCIEIRRDRTLAEQLQTLILFD
jgi:hypothetical protein